jgi:hypothetical protein
MNYTLLESEPVQGRHHGSARVQFMLAPGADEKVGLLTAAMSLREGRSGYSTSEPALADLCSPRVVAWSSLRTMLGGFERTTPKRVGSCGSRF